MLLAGNYNHVSILAGRGDRMSIRLAHKICPLCGTFYSYDPHAIGMGAKRCPECQGSVIRAIVKREQK